MGPLLSPDSPNLGARPRPRQRSRRPAARSLSSVLSKQDTAARSRGPPQFSFRRRERAHRERAGGMRVRWTSSVDQEAALSRLGRMARSQLSGEIPPQRESESRWRFRDGLAKEAFASNAKRWVFAGVATAAA